MAQSCSKGGFLVSLRKHMDCVFSCEGVEGRQKEINRRVLCGILDPFMGRRIWRPGKTMALTKHDYEL